MALKIEELQLLITANADQFKGELQSIQQQLGVLNTTSTKVGGSLGSNLFGSMVKANVAGQLITRVISGVTSGIKSMVGEAVSGGSALSRLAIINETVAKNVGVTSDEISKLRDSLADANTFGVEAEQVIKSLVQSGLVRMSESLSAVDARTGESVKGVTALTLVMKDLAAAAGIASADGIDRVTRFIQRGETSFVDGMIELGNLGREYEFFARSLGKSRNDLTAQEEAQARMNIVMREGDKVWGSYANSLQSSGKVMADIPKVIRGIAQIVGSALEPILAVGASGIIQIFTGLRQGARDNTEAMRSWANGVAGYIVAVIRAVGSLLSTIPLIGKNFQKMAAFTVKPIQANKGLTNGIKSTGDAMDDTADSAKDLQKEMKGLAGFDEMNVLGDPKKAAGGSNNVSGADPLLGGGGAVGSLDTDKINKVADETTAKFKKMHDTIDAFLKPITEFTIFGKPIVEIFTSLAKWGTIAVIAFKVLGVVMSPLASGFKVLVAIITPVLSVLQYIGAAILGISTPVLLLIGVLTLVAGAFVYLYKNSESFRNSINQVGVKIQEVAQVFMSRIPAIVDAISPLTDAIGNLLKGAFSGLGDAVIWLWEHALRPLVDGITANIVPVFTIVLDSVIKIIAVFSEFAAGIVNMIMPALTMLWTGIQAVFGVIVKIIEGSWKNTISPVLNNFWSFITGFVVPVLQTLGIVAGLVFGKIVDLVKGVGSSVFNFLSPVVDWLAKTFSPAFESVRRVMQSAFDGISNAAKGLWDGITSVFKNGINNTIDLLNKFIGTINKGLDGASFLTQAVGGKPITYRIPTIPKLAKGGVVDSPLLAQLGEAGKEVVMPLENNTQWIGELAEKINSRGGAGTTLVVQLGTERIYEKFVDWINDNTMSSNTQILNV